MVDQAPDPVFNECLRVGLFSCCIAKRVFPNSQRTDLTCPVLHYDEQNGKKVPDAEIEIMHPAPTTKLPNDYASLSPNDKYNERTVNDKNCVCKL